MTLCKNVWLSVFVLSTSLLQAQCLIQTHVFGPDQEQPFSLAVSPEGNNIATANFAIGADEVSMLFINGDSIGGGTGYSTPSSQGVGITFSPN